MRLRFSLLLLIPAVLSACQSTHGTRQGNWPWPEPPGPSPQHPSTMPAPEQPAPNVVVPSEPQVGPLPEPRQLPAYPKSPEDFSNPAITSLLKQAREARNAGKLDQAQSLLERARSIGQRDYFVWSAIAQNQLAQKNYAQAVSSAQKSNSLARGNIYVEQENFRTIAAAREATGDDAGALQARARVDEIQQLLDQASSTP